MLVQLLAQKGGGGGDSGKGGGKGWGKDGGGKGWGGKGGNKGGNGLRSFDNDKKVWIGGVPVPKFNMYVQSVLYIWIFLFWRGTFERRLCEI